MFIDVKKLSIIDRNSFLMRVQERQKLVTKVKVKYLSQGKKQVMVGSSENALRLKTGVEALPHLEHRFCKLLKKKKKKSEVKVLVPPPCPTS